MRIATWNINSLRLRLPMLSNVVKALSPDIVCLQETKVEDGLFPLEDIQELLNIFKGKETIFDLGFL